LYAGLQNDRAARRLAYRGPNVYRSTLHRVINASGRERYLVPFFINGDPDYPITCIPTCLAPGESPEFPDTTITQHFSNMYRKTYVV
jgi:isopenicillin N synthase-like dioxygenase